MKLRIEDLVATYGQDQWKLGPINAEIPADQTLGIIGPNGAGKTSLFHVMIGAMPLERGTVYLEGTSLLELTAKQRARKVAFLEQSPSVRFDFSVRKIVEMADYASKTRNPETVRWALKQVRMDDKSNTSIQQLSAGQQQRVFLARALAQEPEVLLIDEPSTGLDIKFRWKIPEILQRARSRFGSLTVLWAQHNLEQCSRVSDAVLLLDDGEVFDGPSTPQKVITSQNLKSVYDVDAEVRFDYETGGVKISPAKNQNLSRRQFMFN